MSKFNWNRFYDELETADPKKFPYWMWFVQELGGIIGTIVTSIVIGILMTFIVLITMGLTARYFHEHEISRYDVEMFCRSYLDDYEI